MCRLHVDEAMENTDKVLVELINKALSAINGLIKFDKAYY
ncbi:hypothetical protein XSR1_590002 [Xenorhabdus szentirmaii DSM 16338]|uniref:Uncharacterized protein n=1 Tax=Xenorhabdus szentirmaii DSM 16338 TaxID=1427518 RepID=W1J524_9GAMM|nr:hypothetical protein XSR1_590002 [Xenorhabdus szentirmaii DSM 16338]